MKCNNIHKIEEKNTVFKILIESKFCQDQNKWKHKLIPIEVNKNISDKVVDPLIFKNTYSLIKMLHMFLVKYESKFGCRRCLSSYLK